VQAITVTLPSRDEIPETRAKPNIVIFDAQAAVFGTQTTDQPLGLEVRCGFGQTGDIGHVRC
jgi:hypothetical protein